MALRIASRRCCAAAAAAARQRRSISGPLAVRTYMSSGEHPPSPYSRVESSILSAALRHVPQLGFTPDALAAGSRDAGYLDASAAAFTRGAFELVNYHLVTRRLALREEVQFAEASAASKADGKPLGVGAKVRALALHRLRANADVLHQWQEALALMAMPSHVPASLAELARLADEIWFLAGDSSVDFSWYTKRASLSAVYSSAELYMTTDKSEGFVETEKFFDRRLDDLQELGGVVSGARQWAAYTGQSFVNVARSKGMKI